MRKHEMMINYIIQYKFEIDTFSGILIYGETNPYRKSKMV